MSVSWLALGPTTSTQWDYGLFPELSATMGAFMASNLGTTVMAGNCLCDYHTEIIDTTGFTSGDKSFSNI